MRRYLFSTLAYLQKDLKITLPEYNQHLRGQNALFFYNKCSKINKQCFTEIVEALNKKECINQDYIENVLLTIKIKETQSQFHEFLVDVLINQIQHEALDLEGLFDLVHVKLNQSETIKVLNALVNYKADKALKFIDQYQLWNHIQKVTDFQEQYQVLILLKYFQTYQISKATNLLNLKDHDIWISSYNDTQTEKSSQLQKDFEWAIKTGQKIAFSELKEYVTRYPQTELDFQDIQNQDYTFKEAVNLACLIPRQQQTSVIMFYDYIKSITDNHCNLLLLYQLFKLTQVADKGLLIKMEEWYQTSDRLPVLQILGFYALFPFKPSTKVCLQLRRQIREQWKSQNIEWKIRIIMQIFKIEELTSAPNPQDNYLIIDNEILFHINETVISFRMTKLTSDQKLAIYFLLNSYYRSDMLQTSFNQTFAMQLHSYLRNEFEFQPRIISNLQRSVGASLDNLKRSYQIEILISNCFAVDFLVDDKIVIEVNGPYHYYTLFGKDLPSDGILEGENLGIYENRATRLKTKFLTEKGYKVINISYIHWAKFTKAGKQDQFLKDLLSGLSLKEIGLFEQL